MKTYYAECYVKFEDVNDFGVPFEDQEFYTVIVDAKNRKEGEIKAKLQILLEFNAEFNEDLLLTNVKVFIDDFYQTTKDARI